MLLPDWARKARLGLKLTSRSSSTAGSAPVKDAAFGLNDLVEFRYDLAVGDQALDPDELAELARLKIPLVRIRGQWVELDERNLKAAMRFLERGQKGVMRAWDALLKKHVVLLDGGKASRVRYAGMAQDRDRRPERANLGYADFKRRFRG